MHAICDAIKLLQIESQQHSKSQISSPNHQQQQQQSLKQASRYGVLPVLGAIGFNSIINCKID
jgi:hypothetical protein